MEDDRGSNDGSTKITEPVISVPNPRAIQQSVAQVTIPSVPGLSKYAQLLNVIEELGRDIRPTYAGSRSSAERIKRGIVHARILVRECLVETERSARAMALKVFETLDTFDTEFSADSVEWCPIKPFKSIFACGTYQLAPDQDKKATTNSNKRFGRIYLFDMTRGGKLKLLQQLDLAAVLDMKWAHVKLHDKVILGVVNSAGYLQIYELTSGDKESLKLVVEIRVGEDCADILALSLDWCTGRWKNDDDGDAKIVVSDSKGSISVFSLCDAKLEKVISWSAHGFEAWISAFDYWNTNIVYTGGDDCKFQRFDIRNASGPVGVNRVHGAGVTSLHSNSEREFYLASGSYDEILRLWDTRNFRRPVSEINLAGGIWRLKWNPHAYRYLYAACMYNGFRVLDCKTMEAPVIIAEYMEHGSISYGCDWSLLTGSEISEREIFNKNQGDVTLTGTCSFYDHTLKLSVVHL